MSGLSILITILVYFSILLIVSFFTGTKSSNRTFFTGDRKSPWFVVSFGMIGASLSGVTFVSVPGMVGTLDMTYLQTVMGFVVGYIIIAQVLLPLYYKLHLTSIYTYLKKRFGVHSYKTGASFFLLARTIGAAVRMYLVAEILQKFVFDPWGIPFFFNVAGTLLLIFLYTYRSGIKTIIWTDTLQTFCMIAMLGLIIWQVATKLNLNADNLLSTITNNEHARIFEFDDWRSKQYFFKQFISGIFITIVMTGLDQDMMQKNLTCKNLKEAQKNMYVYGFAFLPVNLLFLVLGLLLLVMAQQFQIILPPTGDAILPLFATSGILGNLVPFFFTIGIIAASFASADSALAALTTSFCIDIIDINKYHGAKAKKLRILSQLIITALFIIIIFMFREFNSKNIIDAIYTIASYTYGPLLGLFAFGMYTHYRIRDKLAPLICVASPFIAYATDYFVSRFTGYKFGYEILLINGLITFTGLKLISNGNQRRSISA